MHIVLKLNIAHYVDLETNKIGFSKHLTVFYSTILLSEFSFESKNKIGFPNYAVPYFTLPGYVLFYLFLFIFVFLSCFVLCFSSLPSFVSSHSSIDSLASHHVAPLQHTKPDLVNYTVPKFMDFISHVMKQRKKTAHLTSSWSALSQAMKTQSKERFLQLPGVCQYGYATLNNYQVM